MISQFLFQIFDCYSTVVSRIRQMSQFLFSKFWFSSYIREVNKIRVTLLPILSPLFVLFYFSLEVQQRNNRFRKGRRKESILSSTGLCQSLGSASKEQMSHFPFLYCELLAVVCMNVKSEESIPHSKYWFQSSVVRMKEKRNQLFLSLDSFIKCSKEIIYSVRI